jgi:small subunit ribosomal protein S1
MSDVLQVNDVLQENNTMETGVQENENVLEMTELQKGYVRMAYFNKTLNEDVVAVENKFKKEIVVVPESEMVAKSGPRGLVGRIIDYVETGRTVDQLDENGEMKTLKVVSMIQAMPIKREILIKQIRDVGEVVSGRITNIQYWGAYVSINGVSCVLRNCDFSSDHTTIAHVHEVGDIIDGLTFRKVTENDRIGVRMFKPYKSDIPVDYSQFEKGTVVVGTIRNVKTFGCFVGIAPEIDALCPIPMTMDIQEGLTVKCTLTGVDLSEDLPRKKVRGRIDEIIPDVIGC